MEFLRDLFAALLVMIGVVWILQGVNILPGSFMTGDLRWAAAGLVSAVVGIVLLRRRRSEDKEG